MSAQTFLRRWFVWAALTVVGVTVYPIIYTAMAELRTSPLHALAVGVVGVLAVNLPYYLWRRRVEP